MTNSKTINVTWNKLDSIIIEFINQVRIRPDVIIGIQRGGLIPSIFISHKLNVREFIVVNVQRTSSDDINAIKKNPIMIENNQLSAIVNKNILLVDDIVGTGLTLNYLKENLTKYNPHSISVFTCFLNLDNWEQCNSKSPDEKIDFIGEKVRGWVIFPWE